LLRGLGAGAERIGAFASAVTSKLGTAGRLIADSRIGTAIKGAGRSLGRALGLGERAAAGAGLEFRSLGAAAAKDVGETGASRSLFHYTDEVGQAGILRSLRLNPSLKSITPSDAYYGNGQYLSDIRPGTYSNASLSSRFLRNPYQGARFSHYVEIDVAGLDVLEGRPGVFVIPNDEPLDVFGRILSWGKNQ
jgi:hypothetical protein